MSSFQCGKSSNWIFNKWIGNWHFQSATRRKAKTKWRSGQTYKGSWWTIIATTRLRTTSLFAPPKSPLAEGYHQQLTPTLQRTRPSSLRYSRSMHRTNGSSSPGLSVHHKRSQSCRRPRRTFHPDLNYDNEDEDEMRPRTSSMPSKGNIRRPQSLKVRPTHSHNQTPDDGAEQDPCPFYRVRSFTSSSKGIINRGDSFKRRRRMGTSDASVDSIDSCPDKLRHTWSTQSQGSRGSSVSSTVDYDTPASYRVIILGATGVGKTALIRQFKTSDYMGNADTSLSVSNHIFIWCNEFQSISLLQVHNH